MTMVQIIGVAVAGIVLLLLVIALIVSRRRGKGGEEAKSQAGGSFLDEAPQDTFAGLGKAERAVEDITLDPATQRATAAEPADAARPVAEPHSQAPEPAAHDEAAPLSPEAGTPQPAGPQPAGLGLDWGPDLSVRELPPVQPASPTWGEEPEDEMTRAMRPQNETTGELRPAEPALRPRRNRRPQPRRARMLRGHRALRMPRRLPGPGRRTHGRPNPLRMTSPTRNSPPGARRPVPAPQSPRPPLGHHRHHQQQAGGPAGPRGAAHAHRPHDL